ncbi:MAG TPA: MBL fold metallo-hydrolase [Gemmatimonadaceae bacterium]|nr:MBL fold metallo-hydrolase [Gemmatimonadaceae bacterium]
MIFRRFYDESLAQATYLIGCEKSREAIVVDPGLELARYEHAAAAERLRIAHVTETHIHADFVSGARELADRLGATLYLSGEGAGDWGYTTSALESAERLGTGARIETGRVSLEAVHTPGHTPEHITLVVTDKDRGDEPVGALTGDFIFVGDVGRPDLLERAAGAAGNARRSASQLFESIRKFSSRPDHLQLWPGHGAGSACGKALGAMPQTTLGYERLFNWAFQNLDEPQFVKRALEDQPVPPRYFAEMKKLNRDSTPLPPTPTPVIARAGAIRAALEAGETVVDVRSTEAFAAKHIPGTMNIPLGKSFLNWVGALVPYERDVFFILSTDPAGAMEIFSEELRKVGLVRISGFAGPGVVDKWKGKKDDVTRQTQIDVRTLDSLRSDKRLQVVDVRAPDEWSAGHLPGALHIPLAALPDRLREIHRTSPVVVHCKGGGRSAIAASFLEANGFSQVANLAGGFDAWTANDLPVER